MKKISVLVLSLFTVTALAASTNLVVFAKDGDGTRSPANNEGTPVTNTLTGRPQMSEKPDSSEKPEMSEKPELSGSPKSNEDNGDSQRCMKMYSNVNGLTQKYTNSQKENETKYNRSIDLLTKISSTLKGKQIDTTSLDSEISTLKTKVQKFSQDMTILITELKSFPNSRCNGIPNVSGTPNPSEMPSPSIMETKPVTTQSLTTQNQKNSSKVTSIRLNPSQLKKVESDNLSTLRKDLANVKNDMDDIKNFYKDVIKPTILDLRNQVEQVTVTPSTSPSVTNTISVTR